MRILYAIPNYSKRPQDIRMVNRCVKTLLQYEQFSADDIFIFDDGSPFFDQDLFTTKRIIRRKENKGYSTTINDALRMAKTYRYDLVCTVNSDIELIQPIANRAAAVFSFDPTIAVVGGMLLYPTGKIQSAGIGLEDNGAPIEYFKCEEIAHGHHEANTPKYVVGVTGALQFIRVSAIDEIGMYDENFTLSYEDVEFCYRTWRKRFKVFYDPHIKAIHVESATRGYFTGPREIASLNHWLKLFRGSPKAYQKVMGFVDSSNLEGQRLVAFRKKAEELRLAKLYGPPRQSQHT